MRAGHMQQRCLLLFENIKMILCPQPLALIMKFDWFMSFSIHFITSVVKREHLDLISWYITILFIHILLTYSEWFHSPPTCIPQTNIAWGCQSSQGILKRPASSCSCLHSPCLMGIPILRHTSTRSCWAAPWATVSVNLHPWQAWWPFCFTCYLITRFHMPSYGDITASPMTSTYPQLLLKKKNQKLNKTPEIVFFKMFQLLMIAQKDPLFSFRLVQQNHPADTLSSNI